MHGRHSTPGHWVVSCTCSMHSRNVCDSGIELLKDRIPKMIANFGITRSIPSLCCARSWNVAHCWNFTSFPLFCNTFSFNYSCCYIWRRNNAELLSWVILKARLSFVRVTELGNPRTSCSVRFFPVSFAGSAYLQNWLDTLEVLLGPPLYKQLTLPASSTHSSFTHYICM